MAEGKTITYGVIKNNQPATTTQQVVKPIVVNGVLTPDNNDINPGVNSRDHQ